MMVFLKSRFTAIFHILSGLLIGFFIALLLCAHVLEELMPVERINLRYSRAAETNYIRGCIDGLNASGVPLDHSKALMCRENGIKIQQFIYDYLNSDSNFIEDIEAIPSPLLELEDEEEPFEKLEGTEYSRLLIIKTMVADRI